MFGFFKKIFGAGSETDQSAQEMTEQALDHTKKVVSQVAASAIDMSEKAVEVSLDGARAVEKTMADNLAEAQTMVSDTLAKSEAMVGETVEQAQQAVSDFPENVVKAQEAATDAVSDVAETVVSNVAAAAAAGVAVANTVSDFVTEGGPAPVDVAPVSSTDVPEPSQPVQFLDRDEFVLPRSSLVVKAMADIAAQFGDTAVAKGLRVYEYSLAGAFAYDLRVDRELLALAALFAQTGDGAGDRAQSFCVAEGMWDALAEKVKDTILQSETGVNSDILETRALALGMMAEKSGGSVAFINGATSAQTIKQHAA